MGLQMVGLYVFCVCSCTFRKGWYCFNPYAFFELPVIIQVDELAAAPQQLLGMEDNTSIAC